MRKSYLYICIAAVAFVGVLSLLLLLVGIIVPDGSKLALGGFEKIFTASPDISFKSGSLITRFGDYSLNINLGFNKPFLSFMSDAAEIHINVLVAAAILAGVVSSFFLPEASLITSSVVGLLGLVSVVRMVDFVRLHAGEVRNWDAAAGCFWILLLILSFFLFNGMIGIGNRILRGVFIFQIGRILIVSVIVGIIANAFAMILAALAYVTIGLGFFSGIVLWFVVSFVFVAFCEVMSVMSY